MTENLALMRKQYGHPEALGIAATFLSRLYLPQAAFTLTRWVDMPSWKVPTPFNQDAPGTCGFAGCAIGWIGHAELFSHLGFNVYHNIRGPSYFVGADSASHVFLNWEAVCIFFDISEDLAKSFFSEGAYDSHPVTPAMVGAKIDGYLRSGTC